MAVLQSGAAKSGNYWLWKIINSILIESNVEIKSFLKEQDIYSELQGMSDLTHENQQETDVIDVDKDGAFWRVSSIVREEITDFQEYANKATHIWTHSPWHSNFDSVLKSVDKVVYIIRDPRDVSISMANFAFSPYMLKYHPHTETDVSSYLDNRLEWEVRSWSKHVSEWLFHAPDNVYFVFYENLKNNFDGELLKLANYLDINISNEQVERIKHTVSRSTMSLNNPDHVRTKKKGDWRVTLSQSQKNKVANSSQELIKLLGYSDNEESQNKLSIPEKLALQQIISNNKMGLFVTLRAVGAVLFGRRTFSTKINLIKKYLPI